MTMNFLSNFSTTDLTLIGLGFSLLNYSLYCLYTQSIPLGYKTIYLTDSLDSESVSSLTTTDTVTPNVNQTNPTTQITDRIDEIIGLLKAEGPNIYHLSDEALKDRILNILYGMCSEGSDLSGVDTVSQSVMDLITKQDPGRTDFFGNVNSWVNTVQNESISTTNNQLFEKWDEHFEVISLIMKDLKSQLANNLNVPHINDFFEGIRLAKFEELLKDNSITWTPYKVDLLKRLIESTDINSLMLQSCNSDLIGKLFFMTIGG